MEPMTLGDDRIAVGEEVLPDNMNLHDTLPTQVGIYEATEELVEPTTALEAEGIISFTTNCGSNQFIDPYNCNLMFTLRIVKADGTHLVAGDAQSRHVTLINGIGYSLFKSITVKLNDAIISTTDLYSWKADLDIRLGYTKAVKRGALQLLGFDEESIAFDEDDANNTAFGNNPGPNYRALARRYQRGRHSAPIVILSPIFCDIFQQQKFLPPNTKLTIELTKNSFPFCLLTYIPVGTQDYKILVEKCQMIVKKTKMDNSIVKEMDSVTLAGNRMLYPIRRVEMSYYTKGPGTADISVQNVVEGILPRRIFFVFIRQDAFSGDRDRDPFNYQHFNISELTLKTNHETLPYIPITCDFEHKNYVLPLYSLLRATGTYNSDVDDLGITYSNYMNRNVIFGFDLSGSEISPGEAFELTKKGNINAVIKLSAVTAAAIEIIVYAEYDSEITINQYGKVSKLEYA